MAVWRAWALGALLALGTAAGAETAADGVVRQLREQGYVEFSIDRTWLGRIQVIAMTPDGSRREIVFSPATGEILRDYVADADGEPAAPPIIDREADHSVQGDGGPGGGDSHSRQGNGNGGHPGAGGDAEVGGQGGNGGNGSRPDREQGGHGNGGRPDHAGGNGGGEG